MKSYWNNLLKIREQRITQAQRTLAAARAAEEKCEAACVQTQQRIETLQQALHRNGQTTACQSVPLDRVLIAQQESQSLRQQISRETERLLKEQQALGEARRVRADKAANYLLMQRKQENVQQQRRKEQRVAAQRAADVEEELAAEQWRERFSTSGVPT